MSWATLAIFLGMASFASMALMSLWLLARTQGLVRSDRVVLVAACASGGLAILALSLFI